MGDNADCSSSSAQHTPPHPGEVESCWGVALLLENRERNQKGESLPLPTYRCLGRAARLPDDITPEAAHLHPVHHNTQAMICIGSFFRTACFPPNFAEAAVAGQRHDNDDDMAELEDEIDGALPSNKPMGLMRCDGIGLQIAQEPFPSAYDGIRGDVKGTVASAHLPTAPPNVEGDVFISSLEDRLGASLPKREKEWGDATQPQSDSDALRSPWHSLYDTNGGDGVGGMNGNNEDEAAPRGTSPFKAWYDSVRDDIHKRGTAQVARDAASLVADRLRLIMESSKDAAFNMGRPKEVVVKTYDKTRVICGKMMQITKHVYGSAERLFAPAFPVGLDERFRRREGPEGE
ncbi:unnamed protein product [Vitrella brassicaformis CCMP3155]|uniref:Uncharacterized protein n=2 Tax=Vitrella brassicaformis TaxID=1169539 RepID=A0A0G4FU86_VITBC|nr:unnamed protein product [Vitrella brassicaformis CCMP3155]|mmetsp:Transcript_2252/g.6086  ORF Transcript_2252/g.6086 Transcript_2252/m.6086 type:complete len:347 (-) Transcript_2252:36-1076(-)|eukprot:CEM18256.1 unnamed protein product [Vitrella brassicaformis CCMP3155]